MKLWIDDIRPAPDGWVWAKTLDSALRLYLMEAPDVISFDHDLGGDETSMPLAKLIEENAFNGNRETATGLGLGQCNGWPGSALDATQR